MRKYIKNHDFQSFSQKLAKSKSISVGDLENFLTESINQGLEQFVKLLLDKGANPNELGSGSFWKPIHLAIEQGNFTIVDLLIKAGADIESPDNSGFTPLHHAVDMEADGAYQLGGMPIPEISKLLIDVGADPSAQDFSGTSVTELAQQYEYQAFLDLVQRRVIVTE